MKINRDRERMLPRIGGTSQIALVLGIVFSRLDIPGLGFISGVIIGYSIVGNLAFMVFTREKGKSKIEIYERRSQ